jgi:hypothetical protein
MLSVWLDLEQLDLLVVGQDGDSSSRPKETGSMSALPKANWTCR